MSEMNAAAVMELSDIRKTYREGKLSTEVLKGVSLSIPKGALMALVGASGSGKSTLLHIMGTLDRPTSGDHRARERHDAGDHQRDSHGRGQGAGRGHA